MPQSNWAWPLLRAHAGMHLQGARTWALSFASCLLALLCLKGVSERVRVCERPCNGTSKCVLDRLAILPSAGTWSGRASSKLYNGDDTWARSSEVQLRLGNKHCVNLAGQTS